MTDKYTFPDEDEDTGSFGSDERGTRKKPDTEPEIEIEVLDDTPAADQGRKPLEEVVEDPSDEEVAQYSTKVQDRIKKLTHARHDERRIKEQLQRENAELTRVANLTMQERDRLRSQLGEGLKIVSSQAGAMADKEILDAKAALKLAHEAFDSDGLVDAQERLNAAQIKKERIENNRFIPTQSEESVVNSQQPAHNAPPVPDAKLQKWMAGNSWFGQTGDVPMTHFALRLHKDIVEKFGESFTRTDEYYSQIDAEMRHAFPNYPKFSGGVKKTTSIVAPANRLAAGPKKVQLTTSQVALAKKFGMTPQQYAAELVKLGETE